MSSFDRDERQFHTRRHRSVFAKRLSARTEGIIHFGKIKCAWRWAVGLQRERVHDGQETCPEYSIGTGGYNGSGYREVQAMKVHHGCAADSYHCFSLGIVDSANSPNVLLALVVLLLYPNKTFLWKGFLIHGRNPADDWFYIRNTQILWHRRPDRFWFTGTNDQHVFLKIMRLFELVISFQVQYVLYVLIYIYIIYKLQFTSIYTTFKTTFPMQVFFTEWLPLSMDSQRKKTCGANRSSWTEFQTASKHGSSNPHDFNPSKHHRSW